VQRHESAGWYTEAMVPRSPCLPPSILIPLVLVVVTGCASTAMKVSQDYSAGTDFSTYRTFAVMSPQQIQERFGAKPLDPDDQRRVEEALSRGLSARGLQPAGGARPDLDVAYVIGRRAGKDPSTYGRTYEWSGTSPSAEVAPITRDIEQGVLLVDLVDARNGQLVWRGEAKGKPDANQLDRAVREILRQYPPAAR